MADDASGIPPLALRRCEQLICDAPAGAEITVTVGLLRQLVTLAKNPTLADSLAEALLRAWAESDELRILFETARAAALDLRDQLHNERSRRASTARRLTSIAEGLRTPKPERRSQSPGDA